MPDGALNENKLLDLVMRHRLAVRFLDRVQRERPVWCRPNLTLRLIEQRAQAQIRFGRQMNALREICAALASQRKPLTVIKGFSTYALTGRKEHIHLSGDLDVLFDDIDYLNETLQRLGYRQAPSEQKHLGEHEAAQLCRDDVMFEVHRHFPVWSYPPGVTTADLVPSHHRGLWIQRFTAHDETKILYQHLCEYSQTGAAPETRDLFVADPNMCVLISCAHALKNFMFPPTYSPLTVRLSEVADIHDLVRHPQFHQQCFLDSVDRFKGHDVVHFARQLVEGCFGAGWNE